MDLSKKAIMSTTLEVTLLEKDQKPRWISVKDLIYLPENGNKLAISMNKDVPWLFKTGMVS